MNNLIDSNPEATTEEYYEKVKSRLLTLKKVIYIDRILIDELDSNRPEIGRYEEMGYSIDRAIDGLRYKVAEIEYADSDPDKR